ncbi:uncharacterized protein LOC100183698 [Ciona intestinalis]
MDYRLVLILAIAINALTCEALVCAHGHVTKLGSYRYRWARRRMTCPDNDVCFKLEISSPAEANGVHYAEFIRWKCIDPSICSMSCPDVLQHIYDTDYVKRRIDMVKSETKECRFGCCRNQQCNYNSVNRMKQRVKSGQLIGVP